METTRPTAKELEDWTNRKIGRVTIVDGKGFDLHGVCECGKHYHKTRRTIREITRGKYGCRGCIETRNYWGVCHGCLTTGLRLADGRWPWVCTRCGFTRMRTPRQMHAALVEPPQDFCPSCRGKARRTH